MTPDALDDGRVPPWRHSWRRRVEVAAIGAVGALVIRMLCRTLRVDVAGADHLAATGASGPYIIALWHGHILPGLAHLRDRGIVVVTSENFDGEWIARIIRRFGFGTARGSSSRGGARALRELLRTVQRAPVAFTVDGPRGPRGVAQPGVAWLAKASGRPVLAFHADASRGWTLGSWDGTRIPRPFSRVVVAFGEPLRVPADADAAGLEAARLEVERRIRDAEAVCRAALAVKGNR